MKLEQITAQAGKTWGPTPHGVGGLKWEWLPEEFSGIRPTPHGVGGLKFDGVVGR